MNFYTNIQTLGNNILVRSVEDGERLKVVGEKSLGDRLILSNISIVE